MPTVSVVIPTYNREHRIAHAIASVHEAGLPDYEIVVVDDGSTDGTSSVVGALPGNVRYFQQQNRGASAARNTGIGHSLGKYVLFLDSDDHLLPEGHATLIRFMESHEQVVAGFPQCVVNREGHRSPGYAPDDSLWRVSQEVTGVPDIVKFEPQAFFRGMILDRCFVHISSVVRRKDLQEIGGFNETFKGYEEWDLYVRLARRNGFIYTPVPGLEIQKHEGNLSANVEAMMIEGTKILEGFLQDIVPATSPERAQVVEKLKDMELGVAYAAFARRDYRTSRRRFAAWLKRWGLSGRAAGYLAASYLPERGIEAIRKLKGLRSPSARAAL